MTKVECETRKKFVFGREVGHKLYTVSNLPSYVTSHHVRDRRGDVQETVIKKDGRWSGCGKLSCLIDSPSC